MFCNQCGTQIPDHASACPNCGAAMIQQSVQPVQGQSAEPQMGQFHNQQMQGQPVYNGQPVQGQQMYNGQPVQGQPVYNGQPMQGYGMPVQKSNPLAFLTAKYPGMPFPLKGLFSKKNLTSKIPTIDLVGAISAIVAFICVFLPYLTAEGDSINLISSDAREAGMKIGWLIIILSLAMLALYCLRLEFLAFLVSLLNLLAFIHVWTYGAVLKVVAGYFSEVHYGVGFYFYLLTSIAAVTAPFIWMKIKKD